MCGLECGILKPLRVLLSADIERSYLPTTRPFHRQRPIHPSAHPPIQPSAHPTYMHVATNSILFRAALHLGIRGRAIRVMEMSKRINRTMILCRQKPLLRNNVLLLGCVVIKYFYVFVCWWLHLIMLVSKQRKVDYAAWRYCPGRGHTCLHIVR